METWLGLVLGKREQTDNVDCEASVCLWIPDYMPLMIIEPSLSGLLSSSVIAVFSVVFVSTFQRARIVNT